MQFSRILILFVYLLTDVLADLNEQVILRAARGRQALLPCWQGHLFLDGPDAFVIWTRNNEEFLSKYPDDGLSSSIQYMEQVYGPPCETGPCNDPTSLKLKHVEDSDAGVYRCRVHYQSAPAVDYIIELRVIDPPGSPKIINADGTELTSHALQLSPGSNLSLNCQLKDGETNKKRSFPLKKSTPENLLCSYKSDKSNQSHSIEYLLNGLCVRDLTVYLPQRGSQQLLVIDSVYKKTLNDQIVQFVFLIIPCFMPPTTRSESFRTILFIYCYVLIGILQIFIEM